MAVSSTKPEPRLKISDTTLFIAFAIPVLILTLTQSVDLALAQVYPNDAYSPLWFLLNPLSWTQIPYRIVLCCLQAVAFFFMILANKRYGLPFKVAFVNLSVQMVWVFLHWDENITVTMFAWAAWYLWPVALLAVQKIPIGWSWDLKDAHWNNIPGSYYVKDGSVQTWANVLDRDILHYVTYLLLAFMVVYPIAVRYGWKKTLTLGLWGKLRWPRVHCPLCGRYNCWYVKFLALMALLSFSFAFAVWLL